MSGADPTRTVHFAIANVLERWSGMFAKSLPGGMHDRSLGWTVSRDKNPDLRDYYVGRVLYAWFLLALGFTAGLLLLGVPARALLGTETGRVVLAACLAGSLFCLTGCVNAFWRLFWYLPQARRRLENDGAESEGFAKSMRRALPRNSSLIWQAAVGILTFLIAVA